MIVFVHGVPETAAIWDKVRGAIDQDSVALALPGFGSPRPEGSTPPRTPTSIGCWASSIASTRRSTSSATTGAPGSPIGSPPPTETGSAPGPPTSATSPTPTTSGTTSPRSGRRPGEGEAFIEGQDAQSPEERAAGYEFLGVPHDDAARDGRGVRPDDGPLHPRPLPLRHAEPVPPLGAVGAHRRARAGAAPDGRPLRGRGPGRARSPGSSAPGSHRSRARATSGPTRPQMRRWRS